MRRLSKTMALLPMLWFMAGSPAAAEEHGPSMHSEKHEKSSPRDMGGGMMGGCPMMHGRDGQTGGGMMMDRMMMGEKDYAKLKTELNIGESQAAAWDGYVKAVTARGAAMKTNREAMMKAMGGGAIARLDAHISSMQAMLDALKALKPATEGLYSVLSDDQKKKADQVLGSGGCMM